MVVLLLEDLNFSRHTPRHTYVHTDTYREIQRRHTNAVTLCMWYVHDIPHAQKHRHTESFLCSTPFLDRGLDGRWPSHMWSYREIFFYFCFSFLKIIFMYFISLPQFPLPPPLPFPPPTFLLPPPHPLLHREIFLRF